MSTKKLFLIDASLLKQSDCLRKVDYIHNQGLTTLQESFEADYGTAFHKFVASYTSGMDIPESMQKGAQHYLFKCTNAPEGDFRTIDHLIMTMQYYVKGCFNRDIDLFKPSVINSKPAVELQFSFPWYTCAEYDIMLTGTADALGKYINGEEIINDYKVTASWSKEEYLAKYDLDPQLITYSYLLKKFGITPTYLPGMITGIFIKKPTQSKNVNGKRVAVDGWNGAEFIRSAVIYFTEGQIKDYELWMSNKIQQIVNSWLTSFHAPNFNRCGDYKGCQFRALCREYDLPTREYKQKVMFKTRLYDPSEFQK